MCNISLLLEKLFLANYGFAFPVHTHTSLQREAGPEADKEVGEAGWGAKLSGTCG